MRVYAHCARCHHEVEAVYRRPRLRKAVRAYLLMPFVLVPLFPFAASDYVVALPTLMIYMLGLGPVFAIIKEPAVCSICGAIVDPRARA
jgi:hypothetical protein